LPVVLYGCETFSLALKEEYGLKIFENRVLRRTFGPKSVEVVGCWGKLHSEELHKSYSSNDQVKEDEMGRIYNTNGEKRTLFRIFVEKPLGRPGCM
jgi:hypothetical protein